MKLALGPLHYYWPAERVQAFYADAADWPVDIVYLGETVCSKRRSLGYKDWLAIADELSAAGKQVVLSTLVLLEARSELKSLERICGNSRYLVEANDMAAVRILSGEQTPFVAGPHINTYNAETLILLHDLGACRWVLPVELSGRTLGELQRSRPGGMQTEVFAYGRMPLAFSARCFTARAYNLPKDDCRYRCQDHPDGLSLYTQDGRPLFTVNGIQLQSAAPCNLLDVVEGLGGLDVEILRISPEARNTETVVRVFRDVLDGRMSTEEGNHRLTPAGTRTQWCNGYWYGAPGMERVTSN